MNPPAGVSPMLVSIGRRPFTEGLGLDELGVARDRAGRVLVDDATFATNVAGIYAIGDVIRGPMPRCAITTRPRAAGPRCSSTYS